MESQPQNPEFRINPGNLTHAKKVLLWYKKLSMVGWSIIEV